MKHYMAYNIGPKIGMPPTRGHDLKPIRLAEANYALRCPPHGGTT